MEPEYFADAFQGPGCLCTRPANPQAAMVALGYKVLPSGQQGKRPGVVQSTGHCFGPDLVVSTPDCAHNCLLQEFKLHLSDTVACLICNTLRLAPQSQRPVGTAHPLSP